jgi:hypothetical protein
VSTVLPSAVCILPQTFIANRMRIGSSDGYAISDDTIIPQLHLIFRIYNSYTTLTEHMSCINTLDDIIFQRRKDY